MSTTLNPDLRRSIRANLKRNLRDLGVPSDIVDRIFPDVPAFPPAFGSATDLLDLVVVDVKWGKKGRVVDPFSETSVKIRRLRSRMKSSFEPGPPIAWQMKNWRRRW